MNVRKEEMCPCKSGKTYGECCGPILEGAAKAPTAEALMRARYSAYATEQVDFLYASEVPAVQAEFDADTSRAWSRAADWLGLEVVHTEKGGPDDTTGVVEFRAVYSSQGEVRDHHERATFVKDAEGWKFQDGEMVAEKPVTREAPKVGRNDPCPCGSGKKYKKCCGRGK
ncbi:MAG TPA: hypothetical protein DD637_05970 [Verrucomicrobia bacterium]|nr:hypothetical protein [Verrucomicrobiota bacterium]HCG19824.1 hypothetical protein [Verrucomicrobiota bacterium]